MVVGRFQVMAVLQAARALVLGLHEPAAKSWGLNRAIFYAAAKRGFKGAGAVAPPKPRPWSEVQAKPVTETHEVFHLGDEMAYKAEAKAAVTYFTIGGQVQTEQDFERQITSRFGGTFAAAWKQALDLIRQFDRDVLLSQRDFFDRVYRPNRDTLAAKWTDALG
jgi:hypothetical protein